MGTNVELDDSDNDDYDGSSDNSAIERMETVNDISLPNDKDSIVQVERLEES